MSAAVLGVLVLFTAIELVGVGGLGALAAQRFGFPYAALSPVTFLLYGAAGFCAMRAGGAGLWVAASVGAIVAGLDATAWATFGGVGPQPVPPDLTASTKISTVVVVTVMGAAVAALGGWLAGRLATA